MLRLKWIAAWLLIYASGDAAFADQPRTMPVVALPDVRAFEWKDFPLERIESKKVDLSLLPDGMRELQGQRIRVRGHMMPGFHVSGIRKFILQSYFPMRFGGHTPLDSVMAVTMEGETSLDYSTRPVTLEGTLTIDEWMFGPKDEVLFIYRLQDARLAQPATQD